MPAAATTQSGSTPYFAAIASLQRRVSVSAVTVDFEPLRLGSGSSRSGNDADAAGGQIESGAALRLGPMHVIGMSLPHASCAGSSTNIRECLPQNDQADGAVSGIARDGAGHDARARQHEERRGVRMARRQIDAVARSLCRRSTNSDAAVSPNEMKSTDTT